MVLAGANIYNDGVGINRDAEEKIQRIVNSIKTISPSSKVSLRLLKSGNVYEGLLWSKSDELPLGVYKRGVSMTQVLESIYKRVKKDCIRALKLTRKRRQSQSDLLMRLV
ncbi:MAG: hypothetical protein H6625_10715 [Bdellovibrionaceae bacterium]|nr:hypothetical protein [Pseudobdellovibrionaceae bacterium]